MMAASTFRVEVRDSPAGTLVGVEANHPDGARWWLGWKEARELARQLDHASELAERQDEGCA